MERRFADQHGVDLAILAASGRPRPTVSARGRSMGATVMNVRHDAGSPVHERHLAMHAAGAALLHRAQASGQIRPDVDLARILRLILGIVLANEDAPDPDGLSPMFAILLDGIRVR